jgi:hypothetical protein
MCQFFSSVVLRNGDLRWHPLLDSHSDIVCYFGLPDDNAHVHHFAKCELTPVEEDDWLDASRWRFRLDQEVAPVWWPEIAPIAEANMRAAAAKMIVTSGERALLLDECLIVGGDAIVQEMRGGRIVRIRGGTVSEIRGGTVSEIWGGTVSEIWGGTVSEIRGGTVSAIRGGTVSEIRGGTVSAISDPYGYKPRILADLSNGSALLGPTVIAHLAKVTS